MTLDDFLSALENLIEDREASDDEPGVGNFSCEDCRACNHCRFCIGCDTCEDCTYCDECMDCTSCTQCKRCVGCEKNSYCDDSRDCKGSRYLTLCVACTDCVHCLACVGLTGGEFYVLNEKRTRKEYFALLRQVQELMQTRMHAGWRPPGIGLASEVIDAVVANRDPTLSAAPWLVELSDAPPSHAALERDDHDPNYFEAAPDQREPATPEPRDPFDSGRQRPGRGHDYAERATPNVPQMAARSDDDDRDDHLDHQRDGGGNDWAREPPEFGSSYLDPDADDRVQARAAPQRGRGELGRARPRHDYGEDLGRDLSEDPDVPRRQDQQPTQPFNRQSGRLSPSDPVWAPPPTGHPIGHHDDAPSTTPTSDPRWEESRERTAARSSTRRGGREALDDPRGFELAAEPASRESLSSPWDDAGDGADPGHGQDRQPAAKRGSLRQAGRPKRPPQSSSPREVTGTGSYRTGSAPERTGSAPERTGSVPERTGSEGTHTGGTGLRLGRKPKRHR